MFEGAGQFVVVSTRFPCPLEPAVWLHSGGRFCCQCPALFFLFALAASISFVARRAPADSFQRPLTYPASSIVASQRPAAPTTKTKTTKRATRRIRPKSIYCPVQIAGRVLGRAARSKEATDGRQLDDARAAGTRGGRTLALPALLSPPSPSLSLSLPPPVWPWRCSCCSLAGRPAKPAGPP